MKTLYKFLSKHKIALQTLLIAIIFLFVANDATAQVMKGFTPRTSVHSPDRSIYNIRGDFQLIGNASLEMTTSTYTTNWPTNSHTNMRYIDIDGDPSTYNSSSATLQLSNENGANSECSNIIYAGLYWTGRANNNYDANGSSYGSPNPCYVPTAGAATTNITNNTTYNGYRLTITTSGSDTQSSPRVAVYTFIPDGGGDNVVLRYSTWTVNSGFPSYTNTWYAKLTVQEGSGSQKELTSATYQIVSGNNLEIQPTVLIINTGATPICVHSLRKDRSASSVGSNFYVEVSTAMLVDKQEVKLKHASAGDYETIRAKANDIYFPNNSEGNMYAAYAEVTDYVKQYGIGSYTVANVASSEKNGGSTGFYGGWGMVVVYENAKMNWRDIALFDGYAYVLNPAASGGGVLSYDLPVSGFRTAQNGDINVKLGLIAGEGDYEISGDFFQIRSQSSGSFVSLSHSGNSVTNFFNSSILTGGNARNPSINNAGGMDVVMFNINNPSNSIITNNQTSTTFCYGTSQDTYIIPFIAMSVDAYVPAIETTHTLTKVNNATYTTGSVSPNDIMEFEMKVMNKGSEGVNSLEYVLPIPYTTTFVSASATYIPGISGTVTYDPNRGATGSIVWSISNIPEQTNKDLAVATLTYELKVTDDCYILSSPLCPPMIVNDGTWTGSGAVSGITFSDSRFILGYKNFPCNDQPITGILTISIDKGSTCEGIYDDRTFYHCDGAETSIPLTGIANKFPVGSKFYDAIEFYEDPDNSSITNLVRPESGATEYTAATGFPKVSGATYYAIPPEIKASCYWEFEIVIISNLEISVTNASICNGGTIDLEDYVTLQGAGGYQYTYTFYNNAAGTEVISSLVSPSATRSYWVRANIDGSLCVSDIEEIVVTLSSDLSPTSISPANPTICPGGTVILTAEYEGATSYQWYKDDVAVIDSIKKTYTATTTGDYTVTYTTGDCTSPKSSSVTVTNAGPFSVSGNVSGLANNNGITVNYRIDDGEIKSVITTNADGAFTIPNVPCGAILELIPTYQEKYTTPENIELTPLLTNRTGVNIIYKLAVYYWWYISSPYSDATAASFDLPIDRLGSKTGSLIGYYNESELKYEEPFTLAEIGNVFPAAVGIVASLDINVPEFNPPTVATFNGSTPNPSSFTLAVTNGGGGGKAGKNLIGNPYLTGINFNAFHILSGNDAIIEPSYWVRSLKGSLMAYDVYNVITGSGTGSLTNVIPVIQGFWVQAITSGDLVFNSSIQVGGSPAPGYRSQAVNVSRVARLMVKGESASDEALIVLHPSASNSYDAYDSEKMGNGDSEIPEIYTKIGNREIAINGISPVNDEVSTPLGFRTGKSGNFTISSTFENWDNTQMLLRDNNTGTETELTAGNSYSFTSGVYDNTSRFTIIINGAPAGINTAKQNTNVFVNEKNRIVVQTDILNAECTVYNALGQQIGSETIIACPQTLKFTLEAGVYLVKVANKTEKIIIE